MDYSDHAAPIGVLLTNLGSPAAPTPQAVRRYLREFLSDPRIVELPRILWLPLLYGLILPLRSSRSAAAYKSIWSTTGAPLPRHTGNLVNALNQTLRTEINTPIKILPAMRFGEPSIRSALNALLDLKVERLLILPLYPQYASSTTASTFDAISRELRNFRRLPALRFIDCYHLHPAYIAALGRSIRHTFATHGHVERLLFSFHGQPEQCQLQGDPYVRQCLATACAVAEHLDLPREMWQVAFQSRFGPAQWAQPYTDQILNEWARAGVGRIAVICPGFAVDCLETLEEIAVRYRARFIAAGGREFIYIPALNSGPAHVEAVARIIGENLAGWIT